jgi:hypothetical protein
MPYQIVARDLGKSALGRAKSGHSDAADKCLLSGVKRTSCGHAAMSGNVRYWHLADIPAAPAIVRYWTKADKVGFWLAKVCLLLTQSGHGA